MSVSMANAIKHIKVEITNSDIDMPEQNVSEPTTSVSSVSYYVSGQR